MSDTPSNRTPKPRPTPGPQPFELVAILLTGAGQVLTDSLSRAGILQGIGKLEPDALYNITAAVLWSAYLAYRMIAIPGMIRAWGFRKDNLAAGAKLNAAALAAAIPPILLFGLWMQRYPLPHSFWIALCAYPIWGITQQFALQGLVRRNLEQLVPQAPRRIALTASLFSLAHAPDYPLMLLTLVAGLLFSWIYERKPNIWVLGLAHGILGTLAYYILLGRNPLSF